MSQHTTRVAALQYRSPRGDLNKARAELAHLFDRAGQLGAQIAVAPEMATTGYVWPHAELVAPMAEDERGPTAQVLAAIASHHNMWISCGLPCAVDGALYNSALLINPDGEAHLYHKIELFDLDMLWACAGGERLVLPTPLGTLAPGICKDIVDDGFTAFLRARQPDIVAFNTHWVPGDEHVHSYWMERLRGFAGVFIAANGWGDELGVPCSGESAILYKGSILASAPEEGDCIITADVPAFVV